MTKKGRPPFMRSVEQYDTEGWLESWRLPPIVGGPFALTNLQLFDLSVYQTITGQLLDQLRTRT